MKKILGLFIFLFAIFVGYADTVYIPAELTSKQLFDIPVGSGPDTSGVDDVNGVHGHVNIFEAPISALSLQALNDALKPYATQNYITLQNFATQSYVNTNYASKASLSLYEPITSLAGDFSGYLNNNDYITKTVSDGRYESKTNFNADVNTILVPYAKKTDLPDTSDMATKTFTNATYQAKGSYLTQDSLMPYNIKSAKAGTNTTVDVSNGVLTVNASGGGGASVWGGISGTLKDQKDLQTALEAKQDMVSGNNYFMYRSMIDNNTDLNTLTAIGTWFGAGTRTYVNIPTDLVGKAFVLMTDINTGVGSPSFCRQTVSGFSHDKFYCRIGNTATGVWDAWVSGTMYPLAVSIISIYDSRYGYKEGDDVGLVLKKINDDTTITGTGRAVWFPDGYYEIKAPLNITKDFTFMSSGSSDCNIANTSTATVFPSLSLMGVNYYDYYKTGKTTISGDRLTGDRSSIAFNNGGGVSANTIVNLDNCWLRTGDGSANISSIVGDVHIGRDSYTPSQTIVINGTTVMIVDYVRFASTLNLQKIRTITADVTTCDIQVDFAGSPLLTDLDLSATTGILTIKNYNNGDLNKGLDWDVQNCGKIAVTLDNSITKTNAYSEIYGDISITLKNNSKMTSIYVSGNLTVNCDNTSSFNSISVMGKVIFSSSRATDMITGFLTCDELVINKDLSLTTTAEVPFIISKITGSSCSLSLRNIFLTSDVVCVKSLIINKDVTSSNPVVVIMQLSVKGGNMSSATTNCPVTVPIYIATLPMSTNIKNSISMPLSVTDSNWKLPSTITGGE